MVTKNTRKTLEYLMATIQGKPQSCSWSPIPGNPEYSMVTIPRKTQSNQQLSIKVTSLNENLTALATNY